MRSSRTRTTSEVFSGARWTCSRAKGATAQRCLGASTSTESPEYRDVHVRRGADRAEHGQHDADRDDRERSRITARSRRNGSREGVAGGQAARELRKVGIDYDEVTETLEARGRAEVRRLVRGAARTGCAEAREVGDRVTSRSRARRPDLGARPDGLDRGRRGEVARLARRAGADARARRRMFEFAERVAGGAIDDVVLLGMGGSSLAPEVLRRSFGAETVPRPRHDAPDGDPRLERARPRAHAVRRRRRSRAGRSRRARTPTYFWSERGRCSSSPSRIPGRSSRARARAGASGASSPASRRSAAATRRCRRSASSRRR